MHIPVTRFAHHAKMGGPAFYPRGVALPAPGTAVAERTENDSADSHLHSTEDVNGYYIAATDGEIGHVDGFVLDSDAWAIRYIEVGTRNWWPGKKVLVSPQWIQRVSWEDRKVYTALMRDVIQTAPEYLETMPITRDYEERLYAHYGVPPYWLPELKQAEPRP